MSKYTEGFYQSEEAKALSWMSRLIKNYQRSQETVLVSMNKIFWVDSGDIHSIYTKDGKFVIDGKEMFIDSMLLERFLKLRELTKAVFVRVPKKFAFPDDWSKLSDQQVLENVQYLQKNYKKYKIEVPDINVVNIDNVKIVRENGNESEDHHTCYIINNKKYYRQDIIGKEIIDLVHFCKMNNMSLNAKVRIWLQNAVNLIDKKVR